MDLPKINSHIDIPEIDENYTVPFENYNQDKRKASNQYTSLATYPIDNYAAPEQRYSDLSEIHTPPVYAGLEIGSQIKDEGYVMMDQVYQTPRDIM